MRKMLAFWVVVIEKIMGDKEAVYESYRYM